MWGSSPLSRGILWTISKDKQGTGIIPALAGNTTTWTRCCGPTTDHPRSRGEYEALVDRYAAGAGSSPLSRGIRYENAPEGMAPRIIPALAGNTFSGMDRWIRWKDHPRSRGEYLWPFSPAKWGPGSSPLSRGIRASSRSGRSTRGIIPALAGNTSWLWVWSGFSGDHPRSRGEYGALTRTKAPQTGSSPLSRGIRNTRHGRHRCGRIIPALAGNTSAKWTVWVAQ